MPGQSLSDEIDRGRSGSGPHPLLVRQNRWRACRFGLDAKLVDAGTMEAVPAGVGLRRLVQKLRPVARELGCVRQLEQLMEIASGQNGSLRQIAVFEELGDLPAMVRVLTEASSLSQAPCG